MATFDPRLQCANGLIPNIVAVDSSHRENKYETTSSDYTIVLPHEFREAVSIELINANVPCGNYNITVNNNKLYINGLVITIDPGIYTIESLLIKVAEEVNLVIDDINLTLTTDGIRDTITFFAEEAFTLDFRGTGRNHDRVDHRPQSIAGVLGFSPADHVSQPIDGMHRITGDYRLNIGLQGSVTLHLEGMDRCDSNNDNISGALCIVPLDVTYPNLGITKEGDTIQNDHKIHYFVQPRRLARLRISYRDWHGNLYDFNGLDHLLVFKIMSLGNAPRRGT